MSRPPATPFPGRWGRWAEADSETAAQMSLQPCRNPPSLRWHPHLKHVVNEIDEGPEEKGGAVHRVLLHRLVCQPGKDQMPCPCRPGKDSPRTQDKAQHLGTKGGVTASSASLVYLLGKTQLWARTSDALGPSGLFTTKRFHEIFIFNTDSLPNQGEPEQRETQVVTGPPKGDCLRERRRTRVFPWSAPT